MQFIHPIHRYLNPDEVISVDFHRIIVCCARSIFCREAVSSTNFELFTCLLNILSVHKFPQSPLDSLRKSLILPLEHYKKYETILRFRLPIFCRIFRNNLAGVIFFIRFDYLSYSNNITLHENGGYGVKLLTMIVIRGKKIKPVS